MPKARNYFTAGMANRLRFLRRRQGMTQVDVAQRLDLDAAGGKAFVNRLEQGRIRDPHLSTIARYLQAVGAGWAEIVELLDWIEPLAVQW